MAQKQVAARLQGDEYQSLWFWYQAAALLDPNSKVARVTLESDQAAHVDDVVVEYADPGILVSGTYCHYDYYQIKYHVDKSKTYCSRSLCETENIGSKSLLQKLYKSYQKLKVEGRWFRIQLISNWSWKQDDPLFNKLRESEEGMLPQDLVNGKCTGRLKDTRQAWQEHLEIQNEEDLVDFLGRLRLKIDYLGRTGLCSSVSDRLKVVGLRDFNPQSQSNVYTDLANKFIVDGNNSFTKESLQKICQMENLFSGNISTKPFRKIGIRSFIQFAESMEQECSAFVCVAKYFCNRKVINQEFWNNEIYKDVTEFLISHPYRTEEIHLSLECNLTLAFLAGYQLPIKSGAKVFPIQKGQDTSLWIPQAEAVTGLDCLWESQIEQLSGNGSAIAFSVSVTRSTLEKSKEFLLKNGGCSHMIHLKPVAGVGQNAIVDASHALQLVNQLQDLIRDYREKLKTSFDTPVHLFVSSPNAFMFFLGRHGRALGAVQLYEYDFSQSEIYIPSMRLPVGDAHGA